MLSFVFFVAMNVGGVEKQFVQLCYKRQTREKRCSKHYCETIIFQFKITSSKVRMQPDTHLQKDFLGSQGLMGLGSEGASSDQIILGRFHQIISII